MKNTSITVYGCGSDKADLFRRPPPYYGVMHSIGNNAISEANAKPSFGNQCIRAHHESKVSAPILLALKRAVMKYPPDSVADYTLMLMLTAVRGAKAVVSPAEQFNCRRTRVHGKKPRNMDAGARGTRRIGKTVIKRSRGFRYCAPAYDHKQRAEANYVTLDQPLRNSTIVTLHIPLTADAYHIVGREQTAGMKQGTFIINTGRGALMDSSALVEALENGKLGGLRRTYMRQKKEFPDPSEWRTKTAKPQTKTAKPQTKTAKWQTKTAKWRTTTAKPQTKTAKPRTTTAKPRTKTAKWRTKTAKPRTKTAKPRTKTAKPQTKTAKPQTTTAKWRTKILRGLTGGIQTGRCVATS
ncbi:MAG: hypothetical protein LBD79_08000 [Treponema sp.]|jgi:D-specific alpha-keto acid dehydrogenase|nr:hypothetical protein [Treponema sp.]